MSRIANCPACAAQEHGVKSRIPLEHTCGLETGAINPGINYRGPNSHCKACEDEAAGIKNIRASVHTCRQRRDTDG
jgi:hypothetical protein